MSRRDNRNVAKNWLDERVSGLSLMHADFRCHDYSSHAHDAFVIAVTELGGAEIISRNISQTACPTTLFVSNPEEPQSSRVGSSQHWRYRSMYLTRPAIASVVRELGRDTAPYFELVPGDRTGV
jgi:hypothetical protein